MPSCLGGAKHLKTKIFAHLAESLTCFTLVHSLLIRERLHISACNLVWFWVPVLPRLIVETSFHGFVILKSSFNLPSVGCLIFLGGCQVFIKSSVSVFWWGRNCCTLAGRFAVSVAKSGIRLALALKAEQKLSIILRLQTNMTGIVNPATGFACYVQGVVHFFYALFFTRPGEGH